MEKKSLLGGQALIEGVMMKGPNSVGLAARTPEGKIVNRTIQLKEQAKWKKLPFLRGIINLVEMLVLGMRALVWSSNQQTGEEEEFTKKEITLVILASLGFALVLFKVVPYVLATLTGFSEVNQPLIFNVIDGLLRVGIFLIYLLVLSMMKDIQRLFQYHGAEHMSIHCLESGKPLTVENVMKFPPEHPRCGTSFIMLVLISSIVVFALIPPIVLAFAPGVASLALLPRMGLFFIIRVCAIPLIAAVSYEILKATARHIDNPISYALAIPGIGLQKITTKKPTPDQVEVALQALDLVREEEK